MKPLLGEVVDKQEAADFLRVSHWTISAWLRQGKLRRVKVGSRTLIPKADLEKILQEGLACE